jgi:hypothetical protein
MQAREQTPVAEPLEDRIRAGHGLIAVVLSGQRANEVRHPRPLASEFGCGIGGEVEILENSVDDGSRDPRRPTPERSSFRGGPRRFVVEALLLPLLA